MNKSSRLAAALATTLVATALVASAAGATKVGAGAPQNDSGTTYASITHTRGHLEIAAGNNYDKVLGEGAVTYQLKLLPAGNGTIKVKVPKVVLFSTTGSIAGTASATVTVNGNKQTITNGKLNLTKGTGGLKGRQFTGTFTGSSDLSKNLITFKYKGLLTSH
ncbi:MAG: hypothetical protein ACRDNK_09035, partial [Solirubrobacteraceae bacterium]